MKRLFYILVVLSILVAIPSCNFNQKESQDFKSSTYICLVLDGTDRLSSQNCIPMIDETEVLTLAQTLADYGSGTLYLCYVDNDCDNNPIATFSWLQSRPEVVEDKLGYITMKDYNNMKRKEAEDMQQYINLQQAALDAFFIDCQVIIDQAYSNSVAKQRKGSDTNGAINRAVHLLTASVQTNMDKAYVILVSDGCDNVGKELTTLPENTELLIVNAGIPVHHYQNIVSKEFVTLQQASRYIFR